MKTDTGVALAKACAEIQQLAKAWVRATHLRAATLASSAYEAAAESAFTQALAALVERAEKAEAENRRLVERLVQIRCVCDDNANVGNTALALKFVREVADASVT